MYQRPFCLPLIRFGRKVIYAEKTLNLSFDGSSLETAGALGILDVLDDRAPFYMFMTIRYQIFVYKDRISYQNLEKPIELVTYPLSNAQQKVLRYMVELSAGELYVKENP